MRWTHICSRHKGHILRGHPSLRSLGAWLAFCQHCGTPNPNYTHPAPAASAGTAAQEGDAVGYYWYDVAGERHFDWIKPDSYTQKNCAVMALVEESELATLRAQLENWQCAYATEYGKNEELTDKLAASEARVGVLEEAVTGLMQGCKRSTIQGIDSWHEKQCPSNEALSRAESALSQPKGDSNDQAK